MAYVIVKAANTPRPGNWILERSIDGINYKPWQYYAVSDSECLRLFGVPPTRGIPHYERDDDVICTSRYSKLNPLENGEVTEIYHWSSSLFVFLYKFIRYVCQMLIFYTVNLSIIVGLYNMTVGCCYGEFTDR